MKSVKFWILAILVCRLFSSCDEKKFERLPSADQITFDLAMANQLSQLAFHCIDTEYPNKLGQTLGSEKDLLSPRVLRPAFYGCFDWHSAVHGHWTLVYLLKEFPELNNSDSIRAKISANINKENIHKELEFWEGPHNKNFERTYGWAWLLKLAAELRDWEDEDGKAWSEALQPLADYLSKKYHEFLPKLNYPIRVGEHTNTAFGLTFAYDYAIQVGDHSLQKIIESSSKSYYLEDQNCPISWEPSGYDFLSPCIEEAHLMSKIMKKENFITWWNNFLPGASKKGIQPVESLDLTDGKLVHLVGLNFSRAWCLLDIARLTEDENLERLAELHISSSIDKVVNGDYAGEHWLASFAVMAMANR